MAHEKKRITPAELRKAQEERERKAKEESVKKREAAQKAADEQALDAAKAAADRIKATWYDQVVSASEREGVRFVVLAEVVDLGGEHKSIVNEIREEIAASEFTTEVVGLSKGGVRHPSVHEMIALNEECEVTDGCMKGWKPAGTPQFWRGGTLAWLIVRW